MGTRRLAQRRVFGRAEWLNCRTNAKANSAPETCLALLCGYVRMDDHRLSGVRTGPSFTWDNAGSIAGHSGLFDDRPCASIFERIARHLVAAVGDRSAASLVRWVRLPACKNILLR